MIVSVVIPNWNGAEWLPGCLRSLEKQTIKAEIIVVDNASSDDSVKIIKQDFPKVRLIENSENLGFAGGVNVGLRQALKEGCDFIALFNNDAVAEPDWLERLVSALERNQSAGIATGKFMREDRQHIDSTGDFYSIWGLPFPRGRNQKDAGQFDQAERVFGASGGASLYRADMLKEIGLFDERFFAYYEDVDISFRAQLAGWQVLYEPKAVAYHRLGATSGRLGSFTRYHSIKNFHLLYWKNMPAKLFFKYLPLFWIQGLRFAVSSTLRGGLLAYLRGLGRALLYQPKIFLVDRRKIHKNRKVSENEIDGLLYHSRPPKIPLI